MLLYQFTKKEFHLPSRPEEEERTNYTFKKIILAVKVVLQYVPYIYYFFYIEREKVR